MNELTVKVLNGLTHKDYCHVVENADFYRKIVAGDEVSYGTLVVNYKPRESDEQKIQRVDITQNRTKSVAGKVEGFFKRTFRADKLAFEVTHEDKAKREEIAPFVDSYGNDGQSLLVWAEECALFYNNIDPNAFYWVKHTRKDDKDDFSPFVFSSEEVKDYSINKGIVEWCVCELSETVRYILKSTKKETQKVLKILYTFTIEGLELAIEMNKEVAENSDFYDKFTDEDGQLIGQLESHNQTQYLVIFQPSEIDVLPVSRMGYNHDKQTDKRTYVPFWDKATEEYKILVNDGSVFDVSKALHGFPMKFVYYVPCNFIDANASNAVCKNGKMWPKGGTCKQCNGTGEIVHISAQDVVKIKLPTEDDPVVVKPTDMAAYVKQPFEAMEMQKALVDEATPKICETVFGVDLSHQQATQATATQITNYYDTAQDTLFEFTKAPQRLFLFTVNVMAKSLQIDDIQAALIYTNEYNLESIDVLLANLKKAKDAGANPVIIGSIQDKIIAKQNRNNSTFLAMHKAMSKFEPFANIPNELKANIILQRPDSDLQKALYLNFAEIMSDITENNKRFLLLDYGAQKEIVDEKAKMFADMAVSSNSVTQIRGLNISDDEEEAQEE